jgi:8-oxo-dGTP pyrophosphatase MutT (NUDIX family)
VRILPKALQRRIYRIGYRVLWARALVTSPHGHGVKGLVHNGGDVLFVRHSYGPHEWEMPGGGQHRHEEPREAVARELREELGIVASRPVTLGSVNGPNQYRNNVVTFFSVEVEERRLAPDGVEIAEVRWCRPEAPPEPLGWYAREALRRYARGGAAETL